MWHSQQQPVHLKQHQRLRCSPGGVNEVDDEGGDGEDEHEADQDPPRVSLLRDQLPRPVLGLGHEVVLLATSLPPGLVTLVIQLLFLVSWGVVSYFLEKCFSESKHQCNMDFSFYLKHENSI